MTVDRQQGVFPHEITPHTVLYYFLHTELYHFIHTTITFYAPLLTRAYQIRSTEKQHPIMEGYKIGMRVFSFVKLCVTGAKPPTQME